MSQGKKIKSPVKKWKVWFGALSIVSMLLTFPGCASTEKGARLYIEKKDGSQVKSELLDVNNRTLIVKSDTLTAIKIDDVKRIKVITRANIGRGTTIGLIAGVTLGVTLAYTNKSGEGFRGSSGAYITGTLGGLAGLGLGSLLAVGTDSEKNYILDEQTEKEIQALLANLRNISRTAKKR